MFLLNVMKKWNFFLQILAELFVKGKVTERTSGLEVQASLKD